MRCQKIQLDIDTNIKPVTFLLMKEISGDLSGFSTLNNNYHSSKNHILHNNSGQCSTIATRGEVKSSENG
jgi:hypothetical protein